MDKITRFINEAVQELHHVRWPTRHQAIRLSVIVLCFIIANTAVFGTLDFLLTRSMKLILSLTVAA